MPREHESDNALREMARRYTEEYGGELLRELSQIEASGVDPRAAERLEWRVKGKIAAEKRRPYLRAVVAVAACFALMLITPQLFRPSSGAPVASAPSDELPAFEVIPLSTALPDGFTQTGFEQDLEKSVYYVEDRYLDDVVVTLETSPSPPDTTGLTQLSLGGTEAYGAQKDGYSLLTFQRDDVLYTLTCRHDINTLLRLGRGLV